MDAYQPQGETQDRIRDGLAGKRVLVTGGLGFIGSTLARRLCGIASEITLVDNLWPDYGGSMHNVAGILDHVTVNISDVRDSFSLRHLVAGKDVIFNLAGQTSHMDSMSDPETDLDINCRAQLSILETLRRYNPEASVVFASTRQIYGRPEYLPVDERHQLRPVDVNGINKLAGEGYHLLYNDVYGIRTCALRLTNTYGPRMRIRDARQTFLGIWIRRILEGEPFEVWGGEQLRDFTYVDDAVDALLLAAISPSTAGRVFNVGGCEIVSLGDVADLLVGANGGGSYDVRAFPADRKKIDIGDYYSNDDLLRSALGWQPETKLAEGLATTLAFFRAELRNFL
jgi:UDP-glucose 4-epimerase